jgi:hypothetical protein
MTHHQDHTQLFHVPAQEWGRATRDYNKSMHKKLSFDMTRERRSKVSNLIFSINFHYNRSLRGRLSCKSRRTQ